MQQTMKSDKTRAILHSTDAFCFPRKTPLLRPLLQSLWFRWQQSRQSSSVPQFHEPAYCTLACLVRTVVTLQRWQEMRGLDRSTKTESMLKWQQCHK
jgi:hypothetical protein